MHEFGHQYWQSMVATNEFEESWLDEGFNSYSTGKVMEQGLRRRGCCRRSGLRLGELEFARMQNSVERMFDRIRTPAWGFSSGSNYGFNSYARTELTLRTLEALLGPQTIARAMRTYHERWRFRHPSSEDFYAVVSEVAGRDLSGFFEQTVERPGILDDEVSLGDERARWPSRGASSAKARRRRRSRRRRRGRRTSRPRPPAAAPGARPCWCGAAARWCCRRRCGSTTRAARRRRCRSWSRTAADAGVETTAARRAPTTGEPWLGRFKRIELTGTNAARLGHRRSRGPAEDRREPTQQLAARRAGRARRDSLGHAARVLAAAAPRAGGALAVVSDATARRRRDAPAEPAARTSTLWLVNLTLALAAGLPGWLALKSAIGLLPGADALGDSLRFDVLADLSELHPGDREPASAARRSPPSAWACSSRRHDGRRARGADERRRARRSRTASAAAPAVSSLASCARARGLVLGLLLVGLMGRSAARAQPLPAARVGLGVAGDGACGCGAVLAAGLGLLLTLLAQDAARVRVVREDARRVLPLVLLVLRARAAASREVAGASGPGTRCC